MRKWSRNGGRRHLKVRLTADGLSSGLQGTWYWSRGAVGTGSQTLLVAPLVPTGSCSEPTWW